MAIRPMIRVTLVVGITSDYFRPCHDISVLIGSVMLYSPDTSTTVSLCLRVGIHLQLVGEGEEALRDEEIINLIRLAMLLCHISIVELSLLT